MRSGLLFAAGAAAGVYGAVRARRIVEALTIDGMRDRVGAVVVGARMFRDEVAQGQADAEVQLRERYLAAAAARPGLAAPTPPAAPAIETTSSSTEEGTS